jgi:hypothetical protein
MILAICTGGKAVTVSFSGTKEKECLPDAAGRSLIVE